MTIPRLLGSVTPASPDATASGLLVLLPSLGTTTAVWDGVVAQPARRALPELRILRVDLPGHGASPATREPFTIAELADATLRLVDETGGGRFHVAGLSLGGAIALELAAAYPDRVLSLADVCSGSRIGDAAGWGERAAQVRASGNRLTRDGQRRTLVRTGLISRPSPTGRAPTDSRNWSTSTTSRTRSALTRSASSTARRRSPTSAVPALIQRRARPRHDDRVDARFRRGAARRRASPRSPAQPTSPRSRNRSSRPRRSSTSSAAAGEPQRDRQRSRREDARATGMAVRRAVLGDAHVDAASAAITPETAAFQDFITRYAWGEIWARPELSRRERSIATLASLVTGGHEAEIRMHVRAALRNGLTPNEITEVMLHTALYAGLPAANAAIGIAREVFAELDAKSDTDDDQEEHGG